ncbi:hypothetical protein BpHYR1_045126 [Brachionus plicatilis]|uniref:Uncharacterized protein n=1 Tax=Brachionus plicatilis TaxID=10195 RepID=A0A3M7PH31_BRAPC|nr:hypothetical protein BpHYR1_045126 [Brachionus plicatilis]
MSSTKFLHLIYRLKIRHLLFDCKHSRLWSDNNHATHLNNTRSDEWEILNGQWLKSMEREHQNCENCIRPFTNLTLTCSQSPTWFPKYE